MGEEIETVLEKHRDLDRQHKRGNTTPDEENSMGKNESESLTKRYKNFPTASCNYSLHVQFLISAFPFQEKYLGLSRRKVSKAYNCKIGA